MSTGAELGSNEALGLVEGLLAEQKCLTAVERFAERHDEDSALLQDRYYRALIPSSLPAAGQQFAFRVDLDGCTGCKACVTACHSLNGLDPEEAWRDVGLLLGERDDAPYQATITTACHHCEDPGCLSGCPVLAYEKDPLTGIVRHLDDQCIGCQYCVLKCPYDVPKYDATRGIVRKCDMCTDRLAEGEAPACVQGCPNGAISIEIVDRDVARPEALLPLEVGDMPSSAITRPTTRYVGDLSRVADARPADTALVPREDAHTPLVAMLIAVQLSLGLLFVDFVTGLAVPAAAAALAPLWSLAAAVVGLVGLGAASLHLGRPRYAFRAFLGWRTSWMSREILVLGPSAAMTVAYAASHWLAPAVLESGVPGDWIPIGQRTLGSVALALGALGTFCSVMIYADTQRPFWSVRRSGFRFFGSAFVLGTAGALAGVCLATFWGEVALPGLVVVLSAAAVLLTLLKLGGELSDFSRLRDVESSAIGRSARLLAGSLRGEMRLRVAVAVVATSCLSSLLTWAPSGTLVHLALALLAFTLLLVGETTERHLFFRAEAARAMPGSP